MQWDPALNFHDGISTGQEDGHLLPHQSFIMWPLQEQTSLLPPVFTDPSLSQPRLRPIGQAARVWGGHGGIRRSQTQPWLRNYGAMHLISGLFHQMLDVLEPV